MEKVNALTIRNQLGKVLDALEKQGTPILVSKGRRIRAVLITPEDYKTRFVDRQAEKERKKLLRDIENLQEPVKGERDSLQTLREMRGYDS